MICSFWKPSLFSSALERYDHKTCTATDVDRRKGESETPSNKETTSAGASHLERCLNHHKTDMPHPRPLDTVGVNPPPETRVPHQGPHPQSAPSRPQSHWKRASPSGQCSHRRQTLECPPPPRRVRNRCASSGLLNVAIVVIREPPPPQSQFHSPAEPAPSHPQPSKPDKVRSGTLCVPSDRPAGRG